MSLYGNFKKAFKEASKLDEKEQQSFAAFIFQELKEEKRWQQSLQKSEQQLRSMAHEALSEYESGETNRMDFNKF